MLQISKFNDLRPRDTHEAATVTSPVELFDRVRKVVRRQLIIFVLIMPCAVVAAVVYLLIATPLYTATADVVIDTRKVQPFEQQSVVGENTIDLGTVQTQVEVIKSRDLSLSVIRKLNLTSDPEFISARPGLLGLVSAQVARLFTKEVPTEDKPELRALGVFDNMRSVNRVGQTYVMEIGFQSRDPEKSARIANAIGEAYINDQLEAKYAQTRRASSWLQDRIKELRTQVSDADKAVVDFKQKNNINAVDPAGKLMNEQQLSEVNSQLIVAQEATAEAKARYDRIAEILNQSIPDASVADSLNNQVIVKLRQQYMDIAGREAIWESKYGPDHLATINLRNQMEELKRNINEEMRKLAESYKSDYDIAKAREQSIQASLDASVSESQVTDQAKIQLHELESTSLSYRTMYDSTFKRLMESMQQQSFPVTDARIIGPALPPGQKSSPKTMVVGAVAALAGVMVSIGLAGLRELADGVFRTGRQIEQQLQLNCLAVLPSIREGRAPVRQELKASTVRQIVCKTRMWRYSLSAPFSRFTEELRGVKVAIDGINASENNKILGFTSALPNEGKSTVSANFAELVSHAGARVLLVDADLRNPSLSENMANNPELGLVDVLQGLAELDDVIYVDPDSEMHFLPAGKTIHLHHTNELLGSAKVRELFITLKARYDFVIVDLSPMLPVVDARATIGFIDAYVFVIEWGHTKTDVVEQALTSAPALYERIIGAILNRVDLKRLEKYESYKSRYYHKKYLSRYDKTL